MPQFRSQKNVLLQTDFVRDESGQIKNGPDGLPLQSQVHCQGEYDFDTKEWVFDLSDEQADLFGAALVAEGAVQVTASAAPSVEAAPIPAPEPTPAPEPQPTNPDGSLIATPEPSVESGLNFGAPEPTPGA